MDLILVIFLVIGAWIAVCGFALCILRVAASANQAAHSEPDMPKAPAPSVPARGARVA